MFSNYLRLPETYNALKDELYTNLNITDTLYDQSFGLTLTLLLKDRVQDGFVAAIASYSRTSLAVDAAIHYDFTVSDLQGNALKDENIKTLTDNGFREVEDLKLYTAKFHKGASFYINEKTNQFAIFLSTDNVSLYHFLQVFIPRYFPHLFVDKPRTEQETEFLKLFCTKNYQDIQNVIDAEWNKPEYKKRTLEKNLHGINEKLSKNAIENQKNVISRLEGDANSALDRYYKLLEQKKEANIRLNGLMAGAEAINEEELISYLVDNKSLEILKIESHYDTNQIDLIAKGYLTNVDADFFDEYIDNTSSFINRFNPYNPISVFKDKENRIKLMKALFSQEATYKLKVCGFYRLTDCRATSSSHYNYGEAYKDYIPNPHLDNYNCLGNYGPIISQKMIEMDLIAAFDMCIASVSSMNISENATVEKFMEKLFSSKGKCIVGPDGTEFTPEEALNQIKEGE